MRENSSNIETSRTLDVLNKIRPFFRGGDSYHEERIWSLNEFLKFVFASLRGWRRVQEILSENLDVSIELWSKKVKVPWWIDGNARKWGRDFVVDVWSLLDEIWGGDDWMTQKACVWLSNFQTLRGSTSAPASSRNIESSRSQAYNHVVHPFSVWKPCRFINELRQLLFRFTFHCFC